MTMKENYKILGKYIKDMSSETKNVETYLYVKENILKYQLGIDISSKALKDKLIEVNTIFKFEDKEEGKKKSYFEMVFATIIKISDEIKEKEKLEKIILCDVQIEIYKDLEKAFLDLLHNSGYTQVKFEKKIDFENLYNQKKIN
jgi:preprotein translocase subunit SecB